MISQGPSVCMFNKEDKQEVLASWLFMQYLLSNDVQIAYAETEGYVPVTKKAQQAEEYLDYLSRIGEDNSEHYDIKILASQLLMDHTGDTFITPVFNGSASLRDAAGQMIENVTKSVRRKETVDDAYFEKLYDDMVSLYHLRGLRLLPAGAGAAAAHLGCAAHFPGLCLGADRGLCCLPGAQKEKQKQERLIYAENDSSLHPQF